MSTLLMQLPEQQTHFSEQVFERWAEQHLGTQAEEPPLAPASATAKAGLASRLYIGWTQHQSAPDMARVFVQDRIFSHFTQKQGAPSGAASQGALAAAHRGIKIFFSLVCIYECERLPIAQLPGLSGTLINAP